MTFLSSYNSSIIRLNNQGMFIPEKRKSSCGKPQEAYRLRHNLSRHNCFGGWGTPIKSWRVVPQPGQDGGTPPPPSGPDEGIPPPPQMNKHVCENIASRRTTYVNHNPVGRVSKCVGQVFSMYYRCVMPRTLKSKLCKWRRNFTSWITQKHWILNLDRIDRVASLLEMNCHWKLSETSE